MQPGRPDYHLLIRESEQVAVGLLTWPLIPCARSRTVTVLQPLAAPLRAAAECVRNGIVTQVLSIPKLRFDPADPCYRPADRHGGRAGRARRSAVP